MISKKGTVILSVITAGMLGAAHADPASLGAAATGLAIDRMKASLEGAGQEKTPAAAVLKVGTGVSVAAIEKHGPAGGPNSVIRRPFGKHGPSSSNHSEHDDGGPRKRAFLFAMPSEGAPPQRRSECSMACRRAADRCVWDGVLSRWRW